METTTCDVCGRKIEYELTLDNPIPPWRCSDPLCELMASADRREFEDSLFDEDV